MCLRRCCPRPKRSEALPNYAVEGTRIPVDSPFPLEEHLESGARNLSWELTYDLTQHGGSVHALKSRLSATRQDPRVLEVVAADGSVFGAVWYRDRDGDCTVVYTTPRRCVSSAPVTCSDLRVYSSVKPAKVRLHQDSFSIGLEGGTGVALWMDDALDYGFSAPSNLFQSPPLTGNHNFRCVGFRVWAPASSPAKRFARPSDG